MSFGLKGPTVKLRQASVNSIQHARRHKYSILVTLWLLVSVYPVFLFFATPDTLPSYLQQPANYFLRTQSSLLHQAAPSFFGGFDVTGRESDIVDSFANFTKAANCSLSSLDLHQPFAPLCDTTEALLTAMSNGGRHGLDAPYAPRGCDMRWFNTDELCDIMSRFGLISVIGDSMMRNLVVAMHLLLRQDLVNGGKAKWMGTKPGHDCTCAAPFGDAKCIFNVAYSSQQVWQHDASSMACPKDNSGKIEFVPLLRAPLQPKDLRNLGKPFSAQKPDRQQVFIFGHGVWNSLNQSATHEWLTQVEDTLYEKMPYLSEAGTVYPRLFITPSAAQENKPKQYSATQGPFAIKKFETEVGPWVRAKGYDHLGLFNLTTQTRSPDGTHAGMKSNIIKAMMVFNWMSKIEVAATANATAIDDVFT